MILNLRGIAFLTGNNNPFDYILSMAVSCHDGNTETVVYLSRILICQQRQNTQVPLIPIL